MGKDSLEASWMRMLPKDDEEINEHFLHEFFRTMYERQQIYFNRFIQRNPAPWTEDPIFRDYKYTNVYRELDRNSLWEIENIIKNNSLTDRDLIWQICLFRFFNQPLLFEFIRENEFFNRDPLPLFSNYDSNIFYRALEMYRSTGGNPFTNAYYINSGACPGAKRDWCYGNKIVPHLHSKIDELCEICLNSQNPQDLIDFMITLPGVARFIAHEFYISLCYIRKYTNRKFFKWTENDWTNVGPGASLGIRLIFPSLKTIKEQEQAIFWLKELAPLYLQEHFPDFYFFHWNKELKNAATGVPGIRVLIKNDCNITLHNIEMWLCEFSKYWKMTIKEGKQRSKFVPCS